MDVPPPWASRWETGDLDELREAYSRWGPHQRTCLGRGAFRFQLTSMEVAGATVGWGTSLLGQRIRAAGLAPLVHIPLTTVLTYRVGGRTVEATPGRAVLVDGGREYDVSYGRGRWLAIQLPAVRVQAALRHDADDQGREWGVGEVDLAGRRGAALGSILRPAKAGLPLQGGAADELVERLVAWFAAEIRPGTPAGRPAALAAHRLRRVEEWIDAHLCESVRLPDLCDVAEVDARALQKGFRRRRGMTPLQWLRARRMATVRLRLLEPQPGDSVTSIALQAGFAHPSRFAAEYRARYGEPPSDTLRLGGGSSVSPR